MTGFTFRYLAVLWITYPLLCFFKLIIWAEMNARPIAASLIIPFLILDFLYNLTVGWWLFLDPPRWREWLFTDRLQRYAAEGYVREGSAFLADTINEIDPGHV